MEVVIGQSSYRCIHKRHVCRGSRRSNCRRGGNAENSNMRLRTCQALHSANCLRTDRRRVIKRMDCVSLSCVTKTEEFSRCSTKFRYRSTGERFCRCIGALDSLNKWLSMDVVRLWVGKAFRSAYGTMLRISCTFRFQRASAISAE